MAERLRVAVTLEQCWHRVPGGTARAALASISALLAHGTTDLVGVAAHHREPPPAAWSPPIPVHQSRLPRPLLYEAWQRLRRPHLEPITGPVDVIHATGMVVPPRTAPLVVTVHDLAFLRDPSQFTARGVRFFHRAIELARREATLITCPSQATIEECLAHGFPAERLRLLPWSIEPVTVDPDTVAAVRRELDLPGPMVLWAGTVEPRKNLPVLLDAFAAVEDRSARLVLVGPEGWNEDISARLDQLGERVRRVGFVDTDALRVLYAAADLFCFPSRQEGFGLPVLEAMAQRTAVITSAGTATAEVAAEAGLLIDPEDTSALTTAIDRLLGDPEQRARLAEAGHARALSRFDRRSHALALESVYREAVALGGDRSGR